ncbi:MAG: hypothetical protein O3A20_07420 [Planctomycetota bacterium]|nr:hypothetical protein [Planctomycetota bacterium]
MKETVCAVRSWGRPFYLPGVAWMLGLLCASCGEPEGLRIGEVEIPYRQITALEASLHQSFSTEGRSTMLWHLLDSGLAEEALIHARLPELSRAAHAEAEVYAARLRAGEDFSALLGEARLLLPDQPAESQLERPGPAHLGGSASAHVAAMEEGEWRGPLRCERGWEIIRLVAREALPRGLAQVVVDRIVFPVGGKADRDQARADWVKLPLSGNPELLDALPLEFRHGRERTATEPAR